MLTSFLWFLTVMSFQFSCSVSTFTANSSRSPPKESEGFYAGLKVNIPPLCFSSNLNPRV